MTATRIRNTALTTGGTLAALAIILVSVDLFLVAVVIALTIRLVVVLDQRDTAAVNWADEVFVSAGHKARAEALNRENTRLHLLLTEARAPRRLLRPAALPVADVDVPVHTVVDDTWLELLVTRPVDGQES